MSRLETWSRPKKNCGDQFAILQPKTLEKHKKKAENCYFDLISSSFHPRTIYILVFEVKRAA